ncbi:MAG TPA: alpha/beta hydrolase [Armatimonadota bacterium]
MHEFRACTVRKSLRAVGIGMLISYTLFILFALFFSNALIFHNHGSGYRDTADSLKLTTADGVKISARYRENTAAKYTVIFSHGQGEDLADDVAWLDEIHRLGFSTFAYDYHGYGTSQGTPSEINTYRDIDAAYAYVTTKLHVPANHVILYGYSLGGGPSVDLAARNPEIAGLILESTFVTVFRAKTVVTLLPFDKFDNLSKIPHVRCPVLVMHGRDDQTIPFHQGELLYNAVRTEKRCLWVDGAGHCTVKERAGEAYAAALHEFAALLDRVAAHNPATGSSAGGARL